MNTTTRVAARRRSFRRGHEALWAHALRDAAGQRAMVLDRPALAVIAVAFERSGPRGLARVVFHADEDAPQALAIGRHTGCDIGPLPDASLRHAVVLAWPSSGALEVFDLLTPGGLGTGEGPAARFLAGPGSLAFSVGDADVLALHLPANHPVPERPTEELLTRPAVIDRDPAPLHPPVTATGHTRSVVHVDVHRPQPPRTALHPLEVAEEVPDLTAEAEEVREAKLVFADSQLRQGVLLGRYPRCSYADWLSQDVCVSRVHALLVERQDRRFVVDCGSTLGTWVREAENEHETVLGSGRRLVEVKGNFLLELGGSRVEIEVVAAS